MQGSASCLIPNLRDSYLTSFSTTTNADSATSTLLTLRTFVLSKRKNMKIILTGSLGHISKPLTIELVEQGHSVTVISSSPERRKEIEALGAQAAIGSATDVQFLKNTFTGADAVYCMTPPDFSAPDQIDYYEHIAKCYATAIQHSGIKRVLYLSSYGAHLPSGTGFITGSYKAEQILNAIPGISLTHIRPGYFYYNLLGFIGMIKAAGFIGSVYGGEDKLAMVSPADIAAVCAKEITQTDSSNKVAYVYSDDRTCNEVATVLGEAIGIPDLKWLVLSEDQVIAALIRNGIPENAVLNLVELGKATHSGTLREEYELDKPEAGKIKLEEFAKEFAAVYNQ
jgi:uncharacterized protein YbjT (DUF2867 family)